MVDTGERHVSAENDAHIVTIQSIARQTVAIRAVSDFSFGIAPLVERSGM